MDKSDFDLAREELAAGSLAADMAREFSASYSVEEVKGITARLDDASDVAYKLMYDDFATLPALERERLILLLSEHSEQSRQWWRDYLME